MSPGLIRITMSDLGLLLGILASTALGTLLGFCSGLLPGLHMNNIAAALVAHATAVAVFFGPLSSLASQDRSSSLLICCFLSACMVAHMFSEAVPSTYVGIPSEDVVSVLPAHRLAKAGLGDLAVLATAVGSLEGLLAAMLVLWPVCFVMSPPVDLYGSIKSVMFVFTAAFSAILLLSEGFPSLDLRKKVKGAWKRVLAASAIFLLSGLVGMVVLTTNYFACGIPDFPWIEASFVPRSALLLPMFAGLFGIPGLLLSLGYKPQGSTELPPKDFEGFQFGPRRLVVGLVGGLIVGWMPGMTSGSAATLCSPRTSEHTQKNDLHGSLGFIRLYAIVSSSGAVFALGALFVISRARSGTMQVVKDFLGAGAFEGQWASETLPMLSILVAMLLAGLMSYLALTRGGSLLVSLRGVLCSRKLAVSSLVFVIALSIWLTGVRGALVITACASLGLLPPLIGVRRIQLMGCLLVPVGMLFLGMML